MKSLRSFAMGSFASALIACSAFAQTSLSTTLEDDQPLEPQLLNAEEVPVVGTFFMLSDFQTDSAPPPYPCNIFADAPVYATSAEGIFIVDDSQARPGLFQAAANVDLATLDINQNWKS